MMTPRQRAAELALALAALFLALRLNYDSGLLAEANGRAAHVSNDLLWRCLPVLDTHLVFVWGFALFLAWLGFSALMWERRRCAYIAWSYALLTAVRSFFIILTPMRLPAEAAPIERDVLYAAVGKYFTFRCDLFFSAHTAMPFLAFLLFRGRRLKLSFLAFSLLLASAVLLGRLHYSIDVFAAFFITYALHKAEARFFQPAYCALRDRWFAGAAQPRLRQLERPGR